MAGKVQLFFGRLGCFVNILLVATAALVYFLDRPTNLGLQQAAIFAGVIIAVQIFFALLGWVVSAFFSD